ncbi:hypothetical protein GCM10022631_09300 [Deinococcus rubellus]|uniref:Rieske (2Fe-2S) protein n=1 Tax=Deinococcus rubellus TaxID=1889240 RepID=UPI0031EFD041
MQRRKILKWMGSAALLSAVGHSQAQKTVTIPAPDVEIGPLSALDAPGQYLTFTYPNQGEPYKSVVARVGKVVDGHTLTLKQSDEEIYLRAYSLRCPHSGCTVDEPGARLMQPDTILICPCHGSEYDGVNGALEFGPATIGLTALRVEVRGDSLYCVGIAPAL